MSRKNVSRLIAFFVPVLLMIGIFISRKIYPFGDFCFLRTDLYHQYAPFMNDFMEKLKTGGSLLHTWNIGLDSNYISLYAYYLASPFNWLAFLVPQSFMIEFLSYMVVFKIGLCGLSMNHYLQKTFKSEDPSSALFAILYAMSAYVAAYSWNVMWMDCLVLMPLILLALEKLVRESKGLSYGVLLGLCILTNYYISIMICLFLVVYFLALLAMEPTHKGHLKKCGLFAFYSLLAGALSAVLLLPTILALGNTASGSMSFPKTLSSYFSLFDMLARQLVLVETEQGLDHWPNIYCGIAVLMLVPMYVMNKEIPLRERITKTVTCVFLLLGFSFNIPNYIWHGFHYPNSLPARQSFLYILLLLTMSYEAFLHLKKASRAQFAGAFWGAAAFILLCEKLVTDDAFDYQVFYVSLLFLGLIGFLLLLYRKGKESPALLLVLAVIVISAETTANMAATSVTKVNRISYLDNQDSYRALAEYAAEQDPSLFRMEKDQRKTKNDAAMAGYRSASTFTSTANSHVTAFYKTIGMENSVNAYSYQGAMPFTSALLGVKYIMCTDTPDTELYDRVISDGEITLYEAKYSLPIGFMISSEAALHTELKGSAAYVINRIADSFSGSGDILVPINDTESQSGRFSITTDRNAHVYVRVTNTDIDEVSADVGSETLHFSNVKRGYLLDLGRVASGEEIELTTEKSGESFSAEAYYLDEEALGTCVSALNREGFVTDSYTDTSLTGHVTTEKGGYLYLAIPSDNGWTVRVDGVVTETETFGDAMLLVPVSAGTHDISLDYCPEGLSTGAVITGIALLILICLFLLSLVQKKHSEQKKAAAIPGDHAPESVNTENPEPSEEPSAASAPLVPEADEHTNESEESDT